MRTQRKDRRFNTHLQRRTEGQGSAKGVLSVGLRGGEHSWGERCLRYVDRVSRDVGLAAGKRLLLIPGPGCASRPRREEGWKGEADEKEFSIFQ